MAAACAAAALLLAGSYTFWSQAVIAEVYALHAAMTLASLLLLLRWAERPTTARLSCFLLVYAMAFGNHLSTILLLPGFAIFLLTSAPQGWKSMLTPRVVALALACAGAGALQYAWNLRAYWMLPFPPHGLIETVQRFWFDVTKADWRATLVLQVPESMLRNRVAMYAFDLRQQFGWVGLPLALAGLAALFRRSWRLALLMAVLYAANVAFAFGYNVGDTHVFYLPSHLMLALLTAPAIVGLGDLVDARAVIICLFAAYGAARMYHDYPALDRSADRRPAETLARLAQGLDDRQSLLVTDLDWQVQNGLDYFSRHLQPTLASTTLSDARLYLPALAADNEAVSRTLVANERAAYGIAEAYGPLFSLTPDGRAPAASLRSTIDRLPAGTRYVLCLLKPGRDFAFDRAELEAALQAAADGRPVEAPAGDYAVVAGVRGRRPTLVLGSNDPFDRHVDVDGTDVELRMDAWLASDTIRRMGYGHVVAARRHTLIVERGVSFAAFDAGGRPLATAYASNMFAPQTRYLVRLSPPRSSG